MTESKHIRLFKDIVIFIFGTVLAKAIQFLMMPIYTTYMTAETYGVAELTYNLSELLFPVVTLCIYEAAFRFAVDPHFDNKRLSTAISKVLMWSLFIGFSFAVFLKFVISYEYAFYLFFILYSYSIKMSIAYFVRGRGLSKKFAFSGILNALLLGGFNILFLIVLDAGVEGYLISIGLAYSFSAIYLLLSSNMAGTFVRNIDSRADLNILLKYSIPLIFYNILYWVTTISGRYIVLFFSDAATAGKYVAAIKIAAIINMLQQAIYSAVQLSSSRTFGELDQEKYYSQIINLFFSLYCVFGAIIVAITPIISKFTLKNNFYEARIYLPLILFAALISCISSLIGTMYSTYKKTQQMIGVSVIGALLNVIFGILLTPRFGVWGVCFSSVISYSGQVIYKIYDVNKFCKISYDWKQIILNSFLVSSIVAISSYDIEFNRIYVSVLVILICIINAIKYYDKFKNIVLNR